MAEAGPKLSDVFEECWKIYQFLEKSDDPSDSEKVQCNVQEAIKQCNKGIEMVNTLSLFSTNEEIEEISSNEIKYLLFPAFLAYFTNKKATTDPLSRHKSMTNARSYVIDFLKLCRYYNIVDITLPGDSDDEDDKKVKTVSKPSSGPDYNQMAVQRNNKIALMKKKKETDKKLLELYSKVQEEHVDDDVKRDYHMTLIDKWITQSQEDLESFNMEIKILEFMKNKSPDDIEQEKKQEQKTKRPLRPFILTKNDLQKKVFGAGYSSLPTYTIEEFYEQKVEEGVLPTPEQVAEAMESQMKMMDPDEDAKHKEAEDEEKERKEENDNPESLQKKRDWDDWKDDHRRGWGNRKNMG